MSAIASTNCSNYTQRLPQAMLEAAGRSFLFSFVAAATVTRGNVPIAVAAGALGTVASLIDSLIRPLIQPRTTHDESLFNFCLKTFVILTLNTTFQLSSFPLSFLWTTFGIPECLLSLPTQRNQAQSYCIFG
jgi:hypothetical protein